MDRRDPDTALARLQRRQHGVVARRQAIALGVSPRTLDNRLSTGRYRSLMSGVMIDPGTPDSWEVRATAALLWAGRDALLARQSAARLHGIRLPRGRVHDPHLLVGCRTFRPRPGIRVHRTRTLAAVDRTRIGSLSVTTPSRTICDLAAELSVDELRRVLAQAVRDGLTGAGLVRVQLGRLGRVPGRRALRLLLDELSPLDRDCASELETSFLRQMRLAGLPPTAMNLPVVDARGVRRRIDAAYLPQRVPVELDSRQEHGTLLDWHDDLRRENAIVLTGWHTFLRFSDADLRDHADRVVDDVRRALAAASPSS